MYTPTDWLLPKTARCRSSRSCGFSLIELGVVVAIMGVLSMVGMVTYRGYQSHAKAAEAQANLVSAANQARAYVVDGSAFIPPEPADTTTQMVVNWDGSYGDNTNFSTTTFLPGPHTIPGTPGAFTKTSGPVAILGDDYIPVNANTDYSLSVWLRGDPAHRFYWGFACYDIQKNQITPMNTLQEPGTQTKLLTDLKPGDTQVVVEDASSFNMSSNWFWRLLGFFPYTDSDGNTYPDYTYTRWQTYSSGAYGQGDWTPGGISGNTITLTRPWDYPNPQRGDGIWPAGTAVANMKAGSTYNYLVVNQPYPALWTQYSGTVSGFPAPGTIPANRLRWGCAYIRPMVLANYPSGTSTSDYTGFEITAAAAPEATEWQLGSLDVVTGDSSGPDTVSVAVSTSERSVATFAMADRDGTCWTLVEDLNSGRTFGQMAGHCSASAVSVAGTTAASWSDIP